MGEPTQFKKFTRAEKAAWVQESQAAKALNHAGAVRLREQFAAEIANFPIKRLPAARGSGQSALKAPYRAGRKRRS